MASSSSSNNMAPPRANGSSYDVFLSFRGEDTRHSFTDHLYDALKQAGILTFRDSDDAERGEELKQEINRTIKASDASIIVLSENYATSTWCLDELSLILDQRRDCNHFVLPLFYHVDPSDVGKHRGTFEIAAKPTRRWTEENVGRWKAALTEVVGVIGMHLVGSESKFIKEVVDTIYNKLDRKQIYIPLNVTGMDARYKEILDSWLKQSEVEFLVIYGMPGSGKSTLAQYIVYSYGQHYDSNSIVERIGTRCKNPHEMVTLQQQLCSDISKGKDRRIHTVCQGTAQIELLLEKTKALIVLDDIVKEDQLEELLGSGNINKDSKIIITTDNDISSWFMSASKRCRVYKMKLLNDDESLELLSLHAFRSKIPKDGYKELAQQVVQYCDGNPLALRVLGSSLALKNTITSWVSELSSFERSFHGDIYVVLKKSYDSLPDLEKELFLHIACFFVAQDMDYVVKILEPDYAAVSTIKTLIMRCFLYVTPENKLMMHRLLQGMGRSLVDRESRILAERSRVWRNKDSYEMLRRKKSSMMIQGLALDIQMLLKEDGFESRQLKELSTDSLQQMDELKLLKLNFVKLTGSYEDLSVHLRWLSWVGFSESTIHTEISMGNMVALDMSYSCLKEFEPPTVLHSLKILNLKDCHNLLKIHNIGKIPNLENLILWNCHDLFHVCRTIENLESLALLNLTGCKKLSKREKSVELEASTSGGESTQEPFFPLPHLLQRLFLNECNLECTDYFPLSFNDQSSLEYMNLGSGLFEILPSYSCLKNLRVLDLRNCKRLKRLLYLPIKLAELYIYDCTSIEKITFESGRFTLQEFGYEGCVILSEVEGFVKLLLVSKLDETDLGHMMWVKEYQNHEVFLVGDYELTKGRSCYLQMLYEFNIMSTSLPDIKHPKLTPDYTSPSTSLSFYVPSCPRSSTLKGLNITSRYTISGENMAWFAKICITNGDDLIYSPKVFGKPASGEASIWLSYWPIGNLLEVGDEVNVSIVVMSGLEILECGASLVYSDEDMTLEISENEMGWVEAFGRDLSEFQLRKGSYYLCQSDFYKLMEVGRLSPGWLSILVGDTVDDTEVRGWRMTGRPQQTYQSFTALKTVRGIIHGPVKIAEFRDEGQGNEELSGMKDRIDSIHDKVMTWEVDQSMIWDSRLDEVKEYLEAVDEIRRLIERLESFNPSKESDELELLTKANGVLQTSMAIIEKEFKYMLVQNRQNFEPARVSSWSTDYDGLDNSSGFSFGEDSFDDSTQVGIISRVFEDYIIDLVYPLVIPYLKSIANLMFDSNYGKECSEAFISVCIDALDERLYILQVDKTSIGDVLKMDWPVLNSKIRTWTKAFRIFVKVYLAREKFLCEQIFGEHESVSSFCFSEASKVSVLQLLNFAKAISGGSHQPEKLLRILDMYETLADLTPAIESFYPDDNGLYLRTEFQDVLTRVGDCVTLAFLEFKNAVGSNMSNAAFPGGGVHHLTRYVMNYVIALNGYNNSLNTLLKDHSEAADQQSSSSPDVIPAIEHDSTNESSSLSPIGLHFRSLMSILESNLVEKSRLYKEGAMGHLFLMNNIDFMAEKVKGSELRTVLGDNWIRSHNWIITRHAMDYERSTWSSILSPLTTDEGLRRSGSISKTLLLKRLQGFYTSFEEIYNRQTGWVIPNTQLRDDLKISMSVKVIQCYRTFVHANYIGDKYIKYSADDLENYLMDLFEGTPRSLSSSRFHRK